MARVLPLLAALALPLAAGCSKQIIINDGEPYTQSRDVVLKLNYNAADYGKYKMTYNENGGPWSGDVVMKIDRPGVTMNYTLQTPGDGVKTIDGKGNKWMGLFWGSEVELEADSIILDTTSPTVTVSTAGPFPFTMQPGTFSFNITGHDATSGLESYSWAINNNPATGDAPASWTKISPPGVTTPRTFVGLSQNLVLGAWYVHTWFKDQAGNVGERVERVDVVPDTFPPVVTLIAPADGSTVTATTKPTLSWSAVDMPDPGGAGLHGGVAYQFRLRNAGGYDFTSGWITSASYTPAFDLPNSFYTWSVRARDANGNTSAWSSFTFTLAYTPPDTRPPESCAIEIRSPYGLADVTNSTSVKVFCSARDQSGVRAVFLSLRQSPAPALNEAAEPGTSSGWLDFSVPHTVDGVYKVRSEEFAFYLPPGDGVKTVHAWFKDTLGNGVSTRIEDSIPLDGTPPLAGNAAPVAVVETLAGGTSGTDNGTGTAAKFLKPMGLGMIGTPPNESLLVADYQNAMGWVRKVTPAGVVTNFCNTYSPVAVAYAPTNDCSYSGDEACRILIMHRRTDPPETITRLEPPTPGTVYGPTTANSPDGIFYDAKWDRLIVATRDNLLHLTELNGAHSLFSSGPFNSPKGMTRDPFGALYVADYGNHRICRIMDDGKSFGYCGKNVTGTTDGVGDAARFWNPSGVSSDRYGNLYVADSQNHRIRRILPSGQVTTIAGGTFGFANGVGLAAQFRTPYDVRVDATGLIYVSDSQNFAVRRVTCESPEGLVVVAGATDPAHPVMRLRLTADADAAGFLLKESGARPVQPAIAAIQPVPTGVPVPPDTWLSFPGGAAEVDFEFTTADMGGNQKILWLWFRDAAGNVSQPVRRDLSVPPFQNVDGSLALRYQGVDNPAAIAGVAGLEFVLTGKSRLPTIFITGWCLTENATPPGIGDARWQPVAPGVNELPANFVKTWPAANPPMDTTPGTKTYYAWFSDSLGTVSPLPPTVFKRGTILDATPPAIADFEVWENEAGVWKKADAWINRTEVRLKFKASDAGLGVAGWCVKVDPAATPTPPGNNDWNLLPAPVATFETPTEGEPFRVSPVNEEKKIRLYVRDAGGLVAACAMPVTVKLDTVAPVNGTLECAVTRVAGNVNGSYGIADGDLSAAQLRGPSGIVVDRDGTYLFTDSGNHSVRRATPAGVVITLAGNTVWNAAGSFADGPGSSARFNDPQGICLDRDGSLLIADAGNHRIRRLSFPGGLVYVSTVAGDGTAGWADGTGTTARFNSPRAIILDRDGSYLVSDSGNHRIRRITVSGGVAAVSTVAGTGVIGSTDGPGAGARFGFPHGLALDPDGSLVVADLYSHKIRRIRFDGGGATVSTVAGTGTNDYRDGPASAAWFFRPLGIALDGDGSCLVVDSYNGKLRRVVRGGASALVTTVSADWNVLREARDLLIDRDGSYLVASWKSHRLMRFTARPSGFGITRTPQGILLTSEENCSGVAGFHLSYSPIPPASDASLATSFGGEADLDKWILVTDHVVSHLPWTKELTFMPGKTLYGWFRDAAGNVSSMGVLKKDENKTGMKAVAALGNSSSLTAPKHVAVDSQGRVLVADAKPDAPVARFASDTDSAPMRVGRADAGRDTLSPTVAGVNALPGDLVAVGEVEKGRVAIYDPGVAGAKFVTAIAKGVDVAANLHGASSVDSLQALLLDCYSALTNYLVAEARLYPNQSSAVADPSFAASTIECFADPDCTIRLTQPVQVRGATPVYLQVLGAKSEGWETVRSIMLAARTSADARGTGVQLLETASGASRFRGRLTLDAIPNPGEGVVQAAPGKGSLTLEVPGRVSLTLATWRPRPFGRLTGSTPGETRELDFSPFQPPMEFVWVPPCTFRMGTPNNTIGSGYDLFVESPPYFVTLTRGYWIAVTECTQAQWREITGKIPPTGNGTGDDYPVYRISWNEIAAPGGFMDRLNQRCPGLGLFRLPTHAEWECACRAGTLTDYYWGDSMDNRYCWCSGGGGTTHPVKQKLPNPWGLYDMSGNVYEFCQDLELNHVPSQTLDPVGTTGNVIIMGGQCNSTPLSCRSSSQLNSPKTSVWSSGGFRVVLQVGP